MQCYFFVYRLRIRKKEIRLIRISTSLCCASQFAKKNNVTILSAALFQLWGQFYCDNFHWNLSTQITFLTTLISQIFTWPSRANEFVWTVFPRWPVHKKYVVYWILYTRRCRDSIGVLLCMFYMFAEVSESTSTHKLKGIGGVK